MPTSSRSNKISAITQPFLFNNRFIFHDLPQQDQAKIEEQAKIENRKRGTTLFRQGTFPTGIYRLVCGKVKIFQSTKGGARQTMYIYSEGDLIGHRQLIAGEKNPVSAVLLEDTTLQYIPADAFRNLLATSPNFQRNMLTALAREFTVWTNRITFFQKFPVRHRLILALLILYEQYRTSGGKEGEITMTRTELAEYTGASLETIVRMLNKLKVDNLVVIKGRLIFIPDPLTLSRLLDNENN